MPMGRVVRTKSGRDRYRLFAVVGITEDGRLLLADGKLRKTATPKKKNLRHVEILAVSMTEGTSLLNLADEELYETLGKIESEIAKKTL